MYIPQILEQRSDIGSHEPSALRGAYDKGTALSGRDYYIGMVLMHHAYRVRTLKVHQRVPQGSDQVSPVMVLNQMGYNFGVRGGFEYMTFALQACS
jgi:hypothetical protein